jgi:phospholipase/carboxylesterase
MSKAVSQSVYGDRLTALCNSSLQGLAGFETVRRRLHPPHIAGLRSGLGPVRDRVEEALDDFREMKATEDLAEFHQLVLEAADRLLSALQLFLDKGPPQEAMLRLLKSLRAHCASQEVFYALRSALPRIAAFFQEPGCGRLPAELDPETRHEAGVGVMAFHDDGKPLSVENPGGERGGYWMYVPEWYDESRSWPVVMALHGGSGHGREYLWTWLREARSRGFILVAPSSADRTWSFEGEDVDNPRLRSVLENVAARWQGADRERVLLTGLSDGATYTLLAGLDEDAPFSALSPIAGVLHPACYGLGHLDRAEGKPIYLVHGALDWLFPINLAHLTRDELQRSGAALIYREIEDLSHTYPREENAAIMSWFAPELDHEPGGVGPEQSTPH